MSGRSTAGGGLSAEALEVLRQRAESLAGEAADETQAHTTPLVIFRLADEWYAVRVDEVREIGGGHTVTPLPGVPDFIRGVVNIRGEIVSVTDIGLLMRVDGGRADTTGSEASTIVVSTDECMSALLVDEVADIVDVPTASIEPPMANVDRGQEAWVNGSVFYDGRLIGLIDLKSILRPIGEDE